MRSRTWALAFAVLAAGCTAPHDETRPRQTVPGGPPPSFLTPTSEGSSAGPGSTTSSSTAAPAGPVRYVTPYAPLATPQELAADIAAGEAIARDPARPAADRAKAGRRLQMRYRQLVDAPAWDAPVQAALPPARREPARLLVEAGRMLLAMFTTFPDTMPPWEIVDPAPTDELLRHYRDAGAAIGVDWELLAAVNLVETKMGRIRGLSTAGARGPMQFIPSSWARFGAGGSIDDDRDSIFAAARHLKASGGTPFDEARALYGYNHSDRYVTAVRDYATVLRADPEALVALHAWETVYRTTVGDFLLAKGYKEPARFPAKDYAARPAVTIPE